jgi:hypothetical protein
MSGAVREDMAVRCRQGGVQLSLADTRGDGVCWRVYEVRDVHARVEDTEYFAPVNYSWLLPARPPLLLIRCAGPPSPSLAMLAICGMRLLYVMEWRRSTTQRS